MAQIELQQFKNSVRCLLPSTCIVCALPANHEFNICRDCANELPRLAACCSHCGIELNGIGTASSICASCLLSASSFDSCLAAFPYLSPINKLVAQFKFSARFDIGYSLSRALAATFNAHYRGLSKPELLLPVPLHKSRLRERGFNQAGEICKVLSSHCGVSSSHATLTRVRNTQPQTSLSSAGARKGNLQGAFSLRSLEELDHVTHIALIDDVVTTMATMEAIAGMLRNTGAYTIDVWCLARAIR